MLAVDAPRAYSIAVLSRIVLWQHVGDSMWVILGHSLMSLTCSEEDVLLLARANKGYQIVFIHNRYFIVLLGVNTRAIFLP